MQIDAYIIMAQCIMVKGILITKCLAMSQRSHKFVFNKQHQVMFVFSVFKIA